MYEMVWKAYTEGTNTGLLCWYYDFDKKSALLLNEINNKYPLCSNNRHRVEIDIFKAKLLMSQSYLFTGVYPVFGVEVYRSGIQSLHIGTIDVYNVLILRLCESFSVFSGVDSECLMVHRVVSEYGVVIIKCPILFQKMLIEDRNVVNSLLSHVRIIVDDKVIGM